MEEIMLKKICSAVGAIVLSATMLTSGTAMAFASDNTNNPENVVCTGAWNEYEISGGTLVSPLAEAYPAEGGTWQYGSNPAKMWSNYWHTSRCHGSSVVTSTAKSRSIDTASGHWSYAQIWGHGFGIKYYYRVC